jgi:hypothetical protein
MHLLFIDENNKRKPLRNEANSPLKTSSGTKLLPIFGYIRWSKPWKNLRYAQNLPQI